MNALIALKSINPSTSNRVTCGLNVFLFFLPKGNHIFLLHHHGESYLGPKQYNDSIPDRFPLVVCQDSILLSYVDHRTHIKLHPSASAQEATFQWIEFFAGQAQATRMMKFAGMRTARLDLLYMEAKNNRPNPMDLNSPPGMAFLDCVYCKQKQNKFGSNNRRFMNMFICSFYQNQT